MYLLDSNVWIAFLRKPDSPVVSWLQSALPAKICTCSIVVAELHYGCIRSARPARHRASIDSLLTPFVCLPFDKAAAVQHAAIRRHLELLGTPIGPHDLQIAAIARANDCTVVTHNVREFRRVPDLLVEDWESCP